MTTVMTHETRHLESKLYQLVQSVDGTLISTIFTAEQLLPALEVRGFVAIGISPHRLRPELRGEPRFGNLYGPLWGGTCGETGLPIIRYEDASAYETLSE